VVVVGVVTVMLVKRGVAVTVLRSWRREGDVRRRERRKAEAVDEARMVVLYLLQPIHEHVDQLAKTAHFVVGCLELRIASRTAQAREVSFGA
jgi:hypothetical protein